MAGHIASGVRKQKLVQSPYSVDSLLLMQSGSLDHEMMLPILTMVLLTSVEPRLDNPSQTCPEACFHGDSGSCQLDNHE